MSEDLLVNITPQETRVALILQGAVQELHIERTASRGRSRRLLEPSPGRERSRPGAP